MTLDNIEIRSYCADDLYNFKDMFSTYFRQDFQIHISDKQLDEICSEITENSISGITPLAMLLHEGKAVGFIIYQIDSPRSDWCERDGWGFIREIYVTPSMRGKGLGEILVTHAEKILYTNGVEQIYLTSDEAEKFWVSCGYNKTGSVSEINNDSIYEK
jgi:ribosomal protein S18 acetylase RimI-like enzyme